MKRDMDAVRDLLLKVEEQGHGYGTVTFRSGSDVDSSEWKETYHAKILIDAGYVEGEVSKDAGGMNCYVTNLTWIGHEFLDAAREPKRWARAKELIVDKIGGASISVWTKYLLGQIEENLHSVLS